MNIENQRFNRLLEHFTVIQSIDKETIQSISEETPVRPEQTSAYKYGASQTRIYKTEELSDPK